jgi:teichuronic acid exporter
MGASDAAAIDYLIVSDSLNPTPVGAIASPAARDSLESRHTELDRSIRSGIAWTGAAKWLVQLLSWSSTIFVVRLLTPADYGVAGMATVFLAVLQPLCDFGISAAVVQGRELTRFQISRLNGLALLLGIGSAGVSVLAAWPIARFFGDPRLAYIVPVMGLGFVFGSLRLVPGALLSREMRFRDLAAIETAEALSTVVVTFSLALLGKGFWALILGPLVGRLAGTVLAVSMRSVAVGLPVHLPRIASSVRFGAWVAASTVAWYIYGNADRVILGRFVGEAGLGAYTIALTLAAMPVEKISQMYQRVSESVFAQVQDDRVALARYMMRITEGVASVSFPLSIGLALVADQFVAVVLGAKWEMAVLPMRILAASSAIRSLDPLLAQVLISTGNARENARSMLLATLVLPIAFFVVAWSDYGLAGIAAVWLIGHPLVVITRQLFVALKIADASFAAYIRALTPPFVCTTVMAIGVLGVRALMSDRLPVVAALTLSVISGMVSYVVGLLLLYPHRWREALNFARGNVRE